MRKPLIAGNWKMFGRRADLAQIEAVAAFAANHSELDIALCPPFPLLAQASAIAGPVLIGAQDCAPGPDAAMTGDVNAAMLADIGASLVILGHSERRARHGESDDLIRAKTESALAAGLAPILCVGESLSQRQEGRAEAVVGAQIAAFADLAGELTIAYEPIWAIGAGATPALEDIAGMHAFIAEAAKGARLIYGGSVKPANAGEILALPKVEGVLVGGASLKAADFNAIIAAYRGEAS